MTDTFKVATFFPSNVGSFVDVHSDCPFSLVVPVNEGVVLLEGDFGSSRVTKGAFVSISKPVSHVPGPFLISLGCDATSMYDPSTSGGVTCEVDHFPAVTVPDTVASSCSLVGDFFVDADGHGARFV